MTFQSTDLPLYTLSMGFSHVAPYNTLQLNYNAVVGVHGKKRVITDIVKYMRPLFKLVKIVNATSFPGFHIQYLLLITHAHCISKDQLTPPQGNLTGVKHGFISEYSFCYYVLKITSESRWGESKSVLSRRWGESKSVLSQGGESKSVLSRGGESKSVLSTFGYTIEADRM